MTFYDPIKHVLVGIRAPQIYHDIVFVGQVVLCELCKYKDKILQVNDDDGIQITGNQLTIMMRNITKNLYRFGLRSGDVAGICASNTTHLAPTVLGCLLLRLPINLIDKFFEVNQIVEIFEKTDLKIVFCDHDNVGKITEALRIIRSRAVILTLTERVEHLPYISDLIRDCNVHIDE